MVEWTGVQTQDPDTFDSVLQAKVNGESVSLYVSQEALDDFGVDACKQVALKKIAAAPAEEGVGEHHRLPQMSSDLRASVSTNHPGAYSAGVAAPRLLGLSDDRRSKGRDAPG